MGKRGMTFFRGNFFFLEGGGGGRGGVAVFTQKNN